MTTKFSHSVGFNKITKIYFPNFLRTIVFVYLRLHENQSGRPNSAPRNSRCKLSWMLYQKKQIKDKKKKQIKK